jgi:phosphatidylserine decarboxylase
VVVRDGIRYAVALTLLSALAAYLGGVGWAAPFWALALFVLYFFRDPERVIPAGEGVVSPADGRVVDVRQQDAGGQNYWKLSIFLSIFDVHVNRAPVDGVVRDVRYTKGRFRVASLPAASIENEQNTVTIAGGRGDVVLKQIAGAIARRIVFTKKIGEPVRRGERVGLIKFGSRVDLLLPLYYTPTVAVGDHVRGGSMIIAAPQSSGLPRTAEREAAVESAQPSKH